ncbi:MAG: ATP-binding protein, partial [Pseudomonadota bacterium]|nr:ATP-binding protein [Pseudomonadota bacterium]
FKPRQLQVPLDLGKIVTIVGPRRAGKTWYFFQLMADLEERGAQREQFIYLNFEDERLELESDYDQILGAYLELYPEQKLDEIYLFFDEIQELSGWEKYVRRIYDTVSKKIFLTGSNAKMLSQEIATSLRGRSLSFEIMPLSFHEFLTFQDIDPEDQYSTRNQARIQNSFAEYLVWGGYPELVEVEARFKPDVLQEYFNVMLYRDLLDRYEIRDAFVLKYLIKRLIASFTKEFSVNKFYNDLKSRGVKISKNSIYRLIEQIFSVYMVTAVEKYDPSLVRREMSNRKIYLYDNGFASATRFSFSEDRGQLLENLVFTKLRKDAEDIHFLKNGYECDFVISTRKGESIPVQVVEILHRENLDRELKGLEKARQRLKSEQGVLIVRETSSLIDNLPEWVEVKMVTSWLLE